MSIKLQIKRGLKKDLPVLAPGEFGFCEDTGELFIGSINGNQLANIKDADTVDGMHAIEFATAAQGTKADAAVPNTRKVNGKALSADISLSASDVGALASGGKAVSAAKADSVAWSGVTGKPSTFSPSSHTHDDRYYTESEMNAKLNGKANTSGTYSELSVGYATNCDNARCPKLENNSNYNFNFGGTYLTKYLNENILHIRTGVVYCNNNNNTGWISIYAAAFTQQSSRRYKENITLLAEAEARKLLALEPVKYDYINKANGTGRFGLIAEDAYTVQKQGVVLQEVNGEAVPDGIDYAAYVPQLIKLCQMQQAQLDGLEAENKALKEALAALAVRVEVLEGK